MNNMTIAATASQVDLLGSVGEIRKPLLKRRGRRGNQAGGATSYDVVKAHLTAGKVISPSIAMETYGISTGSLSAVISRLRGESKWHIASVPITGDNGHRSVSYHLIKPAPTPTDDTETRNSVAEDEPAHIPLMAAGSTPTSNISFNFGKDGPELRLIGEGESDDKPFCQIDPKSLQILSMFVQMAGRK